MPATYAHYRFGQNVRETLSRREQEAIDAYPELYLIGLHGPDIFFYYRPLSSNPVSEMGYTLHERSGGSFFENARSVIASSREPAAALAYAYGVLCHFALDVSCHAYVYESIAASGISHTEIEGEFDRSLMLLDGINPTTHIQTGHIRPTARNAGIIASFYPGISPGQIQKTLRSMIVVNRLLLAGNSAKRRLIYAAMRLAGKYEELHGMVISPNGNPACEEINRELMRMYKLGLERANAFITSFGDFLSGKQELERLFDYNFNGTPSESEAVQ